MPILIDFIPVFTACSWQAAIIFWATSLCAGRLLSTSVIAWLRIVVLPDVIPAIYSSTESSAGFFLKAGFLALEIGIGFSVFAALIFATGVMSIGQLGRLTRRRS